MVTDQPATLWRLHHDGHWVECRVRLMPTGTDVEIVVDGSAVFGQTFADIAAAQEFSDSERRRRFGELRVKGVKG
jgi:hypothetical protein